MKKKLPLLLIALFVSSYTVSAQYEVHNPESETPEPVDRRFFLGLGTGINNNCGLLGIVAELPLQKGFSINGGLGLGNWGVKSAIGFRYHRQYPYKMYCGASFTSAAGAQNIDLPLQTEQSGEKTEDVTVDLYRANNLALAVGYDFRLFRVARINLELGYSIPFNSKLYKVKDPDVELTDDSKLLMDFMTPGGLVIGLGLTFGIE